MESKEFRKGNIVYNSKLDILKKGYIEIEARYIYEIAVKESGQGYRDYVDYFEYVPLTKNWLKRFGFKKGSDFIGNYYLLKDPQFCIYYDNDCFTYIDGGIEVKYLHQFQNLFFALRNEELILKH